MNNVVRELFESKVYPSFPGISSGLRRNDKGEYISEALEDHWQTFMEGVEFAVLESARVLHPELRDMISRGRAVELIKDHFGIGQ